MLLLQEAALKQEVELAEERKRQNNVLDEQRKIVKNLEDMMQKRQAALALAKKHVRVEYRFNVCY